MTPRRDLSNLIDPIPSPEATNGRAHKIRSQENDYSRVEEMGPQTCAIAPKGFRRRRHDLLPIFIERAPGVAQFQNAGRRPVADRSWVVVAGAPGRRLIVPSGMPVQIPARFPEL